jgi:hypothetical protein
VETRFDKGMAIAQEYKNTGVEGAEINKI